MSVMHEREQSRFDGSLMVIAGSDEGEAPTSVTAIVTARPSET